MTVNSTNIIKTNNHLFTQKIEHKITEKCSVRDLGPGMELAQEWEGIKSVLHFILFITYMNTEKN
jgi:hypothetical protein